MRVEDGYRSGGSGRRRRCGGDWRRTVGCEYSWVYFLDYVLESGHLLVGRLELSDGVGGRCRLLRPTAFTAAVAGEKTIATGGVLGRRVGVAKVNYVVAMKMSGAERETSAYHDAGAGAFRE